MAVITLAVRGYPISVWDCDTVEECKQGLLGLTIDDSKGLMLPVGSSGLHTVGMATSIDVIWYDAQGKAVHADVNVPPGVHLPPKGAYALELRGGWLSRHPRKHGHVTGFRPMADHAGDPNFPATGTPDVSTSNLVVAKQVAAGNACGCGCAQCVSGDPHALGMHTIQLVGPGPIQRIAGGENRSGPSSLEEFQVGWHGNRTYGPGQWQYGGRGGGWGPPVHDWQWGAQHHVGHAVVGELDAHLITTPHGPMSQIVGSLVNIAGARTSAPHGHAPPRTGAPPSRQSPPTGASHGQAPQTGASSRQGPGAQGRNAMASAAESPGSRYMASAAERPGARYMASAAERPGARYMASAAERPTTQSVPQPALSSPNSAFASILAAAHDQVVSGPHAGPHGGGGGGGPHGGGGFHGHGPHGHHHHDHDHFFGWGWGGGWWPWWDWGYACDPCDPNCPNYDPTLPYCN